MFGMATMKGIRVTDATLSRPYLFFIILLMARIWSFLALCVGLVVVVWAISVQATTRDQEQELFEQALDNFLRDSRPIDDSGLTIREAIEHASRKTWTPEREYQCSRMTALVSTLFLPRAMVASFVALTMFDMKNSSSIHQGQFILIPRSNGSLSNLDQILALVGGVIVVHAARGQYGSTLRIL